MSSSKRIAWMFEEALQALEQAERHYRKFYGLVGAPTARPVWEPPADVFESGAEVRVVVALPGVSPEAIHVQVMPFGLVISAERPLPAACDRMSITRLEIPYGHFERRIELARGQYVLVERRIADGCLELRLARE